MVTLDLWVTDPSHYHLCLHVHHTAQREATADGPLTSDPKLSVFVQSDWTRSDKSLVRCVQVVCYLWQVKASGGYVCASECVCVCVWRCLGSSLHLLFLFSAHWGLDSQNAFQAAVDSQHCAPAPQTALGISCFRQRLLVCACIQEGLTQLVRKSKDNVLSVSE